MFIRSLTIDRFRGLELLEWSPPTRVNCLIGPGDAGKSTILSAIEMILDPRPTPLTSEYDYYRRRVEQGFQITAVLGDLDEQAWPAQELRTGSGLSTSRVRGLRPMLEAPTINTGGRRRGPTGSRPVAGTTGIQVRVLAARPLA